MDRKEYAKKKQEEMNEFIKSSIDDVKNHFKSEEDIKELGKFMSQMYNYSSKNKMLIKGQYSSALYVGSETHFNEKGFHINNGERPIKVLVPNQTKFFKDEKGKTKPLRFANKFEKEEIKNGKIKVFAGKTYFKLGNVYDITQTDARPQDYPKIYPNRINDFKVNNKDYLDTVYKLAKDHLIDKGYKIYENVPKSDVNGASGIINESDKDVVITQNLGKGEAVSVLFHEMTHQELHSNITNEQYESNRGYFEGEAELSAYIISNHFGLDTSESSFPYIKEWTNNFSDIDDKELNNFINNVSNASRNIINNVETRLEEYNIKVTKELVDNINQGMSISNIKDELRNIHDRGLKDSIKELLTINAYNKATGNKGNLDVSDLRNPKLVIDDKQLSAQDITSNIQENKKQNNIVR